MTLDDFKTDLLKREAELTLSYERLFRSQIIAEAILLERLLDRIIAAYFCPDESKHVLLYSFLFRDTEISFNSKRIVVKKLLKRAFPPIWESFSFFANRLEKLGEFRNKFAHCEIVLPEALEAPSALDGVTLRYYKGGEEVTEHIPSATVKRWVEECRCLASAGIVLLTALRIAQKRVLEGELLDHITEAGRAINADINNLPFA
jgi:hypothetical protein